MSFWGDVGRGFSTVGTGFAKTMEGMWVGGLSGFVTGGPYGLIVGSYAGAARGAYGAVKKEGYGSIAKGSTVVGLATGAATNVGRFAATGEVAVGFKNVSPFGATKTAAAVATEGKIAGAGSAAPTGLTGILNGTVGAAAILGGLLQKTSGQFASAKESVSQIRETLAPSQAAPEIPAASSPGAVMAASPAQASGAQGPSGAAATGFLGVPTMAWAAVAGLGLLWILTRRK
jgi:hypothetical protein